MWAGFYPAADFKSALSPGILGRLTIGRSSASRPTEQQNLPPFDSSRVAHGTTYIRHMRTNSSSAVQRRLPVINRTNSQPAQT
jgi:hypothetical protein